MKAIGLYEFGAPEVLEVVELPDPAPGPGEVRIRVAGAAVSPTDTLRRRGIRARDGMPDEDLRAQERPIVPGMEVAGAIDSVGPDTDTTLVPGDVVATVLFPRGPRGGYSQLVVAPVASVVRIPKSVSVLEASTLLMNGRTAQVCLDVLDLEPGDTVGVTGAAGVLGGYAVQLAKARGLRVIADASPADRALVESFGADEIVERGDGVAERFRALTGGGVDGLVDAAVLNEQIVGAVREGGRVATVRHYEGEPVNGVTFHAVRVRHYLRDTAQLEELCNLVDDGKLTLRVANVYAAEHAAVAHQQLADGGTRGRIVLSFQS